MTVTHASKRESAAPLLLVSSVVRAVRFSRMLVRYVDDESEHAHSHSRRADRSSSSEVVVGKDRVVDNEQEKEGAAGVEGWC